jgi:hypothetical protein
VILCIIDCYVADEIITSRAGVRIRVGNTDAEGRMAMADVLCHAKELVICLFIFVIDSKNKYFISCTHLKVIVI